MPRVTKNCRNEKFYLDLKRKVESMGSEKEQIEFLTTLSYMEQAEMFPVEHMPAFDQFMADYLVPVKENNELDKELFEARQHGLEEITRELYQTFYRIAARIDPERKIDTDEKKQQYYLAVAADPVARKVFICNRIYDNSLDLTEDQNMAVVNAYKDIPMIEYSGINQYEKENADRNSQRYTQLQDSMNDSNAIIRTMGEKMFLRQSLASAPEPERNDYVRMYSFGEDNNPISKEFRLYKKGIDKEEAKRIDIMAKDVSEDALNRMVFEFGLGKGNMDFITDDALKTEIKNHVRCMETAKVFMDRNITDFFINKLDAERQKTRLSFNRKGSAEFVDLAEKISNSERMIRDFEDRKRTNKSITEAERDELIKSLREVIDSSDKYTAKKRKDGITLDNVTNVHTKERLKYAVKVREEAGKLLDSMEEALKRERELQRDVYGSEIQSGVRQGAKTTDSLEKSNASREVSATFLPDVKGIGKVTIEDNNQNDISKLGGNFERLNITEDFRRAVEASDMKDLVSFRKRADGTYDMTPKYPEKGTTAAGREYSIRKNLNRIVKQVAAAFFENPNEPRFDELDIEKGSQRYRDIQNAFIELNSAFESKNIVPNADHIKEYENAKETVSKLLNLKKDEKDDFFTFMEECYTNEIDPELFLLEGYHANLKRVKSMYNALNSPNLSEEDKKLISDNVDNYKKAIKNMVRMATMDIEKEESLYIINACDSGSKAMNDINRMALKHSVQGSALVSVRYDEMKKAYLGEAKSFMEKIKPEYGEFAGIPAKDVTIQEHAIATRYLMQVDFKNAPRIENIKGYYQYGSMLSTDERNAMLEFIDIVNQSGDDKAKDVLLEKFYKHAKAHMGYLYNHKDELSEQIAEEARKHGLNDQSDSFKFEYHVILKAGTVKYKGRDYSITFETTVPPINEIMNDMGISSAKIGIFQDERNMQRQYHYDSQIYFPNEVEQKKDDFLAKYEGLNPAKNAKVLPKEFDVEEKKNPEKKVVEKINFEILSDDDFKPQKKNMACKDDTFVKQRDTFNLGK